MPDPDPDAPDFDPEPLGPVNPLEPLPLEEVEVVDEQYPGQPITARAGPVPQKPHGLQCVPNVEPVQVYVPSENVPHRASYEICTPVAFGPV